MTERAFDPQAHVDEGADAERMAKRAEALDAAKEAAKRGDWEHVRREAAAAPPEVDESAELAARIDEAPDLQALARLAPPDPLAAPAFGAPRPAPLWDVDPEGRASGPAAFWRPWWDAVTDFGPSLVVIDPASVAAAGMSPSDGAGVRAFLLAVTEQADRIGCGALILAHDTKGARNETRAGYGPGAGMVTGSSQWFDGARAVLHLSGPGPDEKRLIVAEKANYGPTGWGARLAPWWDGDKWRGLSLDTGEAMLSRNRVAAVRKEWAKEAGGTGKATPSKANGRTMTTDQRAAFK